MEMIRRNELKQLIKEAFREINEYYFKKDWKAIREEIMDYSEKDRGCLSDETWRQLSDIIDNVLEKLGLFIDDISKDHRILVMKEYDDTILIDVDSLKWQDAFVRRAYLCPTEDAFKKYVERMIKISINYPDDYFEHPLDQTI